MTAKIRDDYVYAVEPPLDDVDAQILQSFKSPGMGTTIYIPFDPNSFSIPADPSQFITRRIGDVPVVFSPNVYNLFIRDYVKTDENGLKYFTKWPLLIVDYNTPLGMLYSGKTSQDDKPSPRPFDLQVQDWKSGYQWSRMYLPNDYETDLQVHVYTNCGGYADLCMPHVYKFKQGWYWVQHEARLIDLPASIGQAQQDVIKFYFKKPSNIAFKIPGFSSIAEYIYKKKLNDEGVKQIEEILHAFNYIVDWNYTYTTDSGKTVTGIAVEEIQDGYVVYVPILRALSMPVQIPPLVIGLIILATVLTVGLYVVYRIESIRKEEFRAYLSFLNNAQETHEDCIAQCNQLPEDQRAACYNKCAQAYATTVNYAQEAWQKMSSQNTLGELTGLLKWAVAAIVVINVLPAVSDAMRRR